MSQKIQIHSDKIKVRNNHMLLANAFDKACCGCSMWSGALGASGAIPNAYKAVFADVEIDTGCHPDKVNGGTHLSGGIWAGTYGLLNRNYPGPAFPDVDWEHGEYDVAGLALSITQGGYNGGCTVQTAANYSQFGITMTSDGSGSFRVYAYTFFSSSIYFDATFAYPLDMDIYAPFSVPNGLTAWGGTGPHGGTVYGKNGTLLITPCYP